MENIHDKIVQLLDKVEWDDDDKLWLLKYCNTNDTRELRNLLRKQFEADNQHSDQISEDVTSQMLQNIHARIGVAEPTEQRSVIKIWMFRMAAASVLAAFAFIGYNGLKRKAKPEVVKASVIKQAEKIVIQPGGNKAILTLSDGSTIVLDDKRNGSLAQQGNTKVFKQNGRVVYNTSGSTNTEVLYNIITTPAGGQYQIELPDGSVVWLNSRSSLRFPTSFVGTERRVEITGEAYFEVKRNVAMPFRVKVNDAEVQVLGTTFNIMAYENETALKTTLLSGQVKFIHGDLNKILKPGQQSQLTKNGAVKVESGIDIEEAVAWKNGMFDFEGAGMEAVSKQISRWYDVEMIFDKKNEELFHAKIPRDTKLKDVLKALELTGKVRFRIDGRRIIAMLNH